MITVQMLEARLLTFLIDNEVVQGSLVLERLGQSAAVQIDVVRGAKDKHRVPTLQQSD
jgi:hypothetical protein